MAQRSHFSNVAHSFFDLRPTALIYSVALQTFGNQGEDQLAYAVMSGAEGSTDARRPLGRTAAHDRSGLSISPMI